MNNFNINLKEFENVDYINVKSDFPDAVDGVITLNKSYIITAPVDLTGDRIVCDGVVNLFGISSETSSITSTGLSVGVPLITTISTLVLQNITFRDVDTCIDINGNTNLVALDWQGVNFNNVPNIGVINSCDNTTFLSVAFLDSQGLRITGTIGTFGVINTLLRSGTAAKSIIELDANCVITRRFRIIYSSVVLQGDGTGIDVNAAATLHPESFILDTINFSGGTQSDYLPSVNHTSNNALFINCVGITNTAVNGQLYMIDNATETVISDTTTYVKVAGATTPSDENEKYDHSDNRLTNRATIERKYLVQATLSFNSGNNNVCQFGFFDSEINAIREPSKIKSTANSAGRSENITLFCIVKHQNGDYIEVHSRNTSAANNITVTDMNLAITEIR